MLEANIDKRTAEGRQTFIMEKWIQIYLKDGLLKTRNALKNCYTSVAESTEGELRGKYSNSYYGDITQEWINAICIIQHCKKK